MYYEEVTYIYIYISTLHDNYNIEAYMSAIYLIHDIHSISYNVSLYTKRYREKKELKMKLYMEFSYLQLI